MQRGRFITNTVTSATWVISILLLLSHQSYAQRSLGTRYLDYGTIAHKSPGLEGNLNLLNLWKEQPDSIQEIYTSAFQILSRDSRTTFAEVGNDVNFIQLCNKYGITHLGGPMTGNISSNGAKIWLRTIKPARVEVHINVNGKERVYGPVYSSNKTDLTAVIEVTGLNPATSYPYMVYIDDKPVKTDDQTSITTSPLNNSSGEVRIAFGTCFHRWGLCNEIMSEQIKSLEPLALLLGGDIAVQDRRGNAGLHRADYLLRDFQPAWKNLVSSLPVYATWDDHDYFSDDLYNIQKLLLG